MNAAEAILITTLPQERRLMLKFNLSQRALPVVALFASGALVLVLSPSSNASPTNTIDSTSPITGATANTIPASGTFVLTTAPGIVPAWQSANIVLTAISPGSVTELTVTATSRLTLPVVAKTGSANAMSGGFRLTNTETRETIRCMIPTLDTKARVLDCVVNVDENLQPFVIDTIKARVSEVVGATRTTQFTGIEFRVASKDVADSLNKALSTTVFTTSVIIATGDLTVSWEATS
jgi:hypothetical protein